MLKRVFAIAALILAPALSLAEGEKAKPKSPSHPWHFSGLTGQHEIAQVQRGFQVYWARCAACHGLEFRKFWHLEKIGSDETYVQGVLLPEYFAQIGETYNPSLYSIENLPASRVSGAPDLSHAVLAKGKTMEAGANYIYSLMLGYDRMNDAVKGAALETDLATDDAPFTQVGEPSLVAYEDGSPKSITTVFERDNFYLYQKDGAWFLRSYVDIRTVIEDFDTDGNASSQDVMTSRLDETDLAHQQKVEQKRDAALAAVASAQAAVDTASDNADLVIAFEGLAAAKEYAATYDGFVKIEDMDQAWAQRRTIFTHEIASWTSGQYYNPFKSGGIISMISPLAALETGHRTDFTAEELMVDSADLELATYWLFDNIEAQQPLIEAVEEGRPLFEAALAAGGVGQDTPEALAYNAFKQARIAPLLDAMHPESKKAISQDVTAFLAWSSDINLNSRKQVGLYIVLLFAILSVLLYFFYREIARQEFAKQAKEGGPWDDNH